jgi:hypothetical protein
MKNDLIELVGIIVKINGKKRIFKTDNFGLQGWAWEDETIMESDSVITLNLKDGKKV